MIGTTEILLIGAAILLLFGATKVPELARSLGKALGEFKKAQRESELELSKLKKPMTESETKVQIMAKDLGIDISGKTDDELLDEIQVKVNKKN